MDLCIYILFINSSVFSHGNEFTNTIVRIDVINVNDEKHIHMFNDII